MSELLEVKSFSQKIIIEFCDLGDDLENKIYKKLIEQDFFNTSFEVLNITQFLVKEMKVNGNVVVCDLKVIAECNVPEVGKVLTIDEYTMCNKSLVYKNGRIQIIFEIPDQASLKPIYKVKIDAYKIFSKNILCVASVV